MKITASHLPRLMVCDGPIVLNPERFNLSTDESVESDAVIEGNAAHKAVEMVLRGQVGELFELIGATINGNYVIPSSMCDFLEPTVHILRSRIANGCELRIEEKTNWNIQWSNFEDLSINGRADYISIDRSNKIVFIDDLKFGFRIVEPENNYTLLSHGIGVMIREILPADWNYCFTIHQPRPRHSLAQIRHWNVSGSQLISYYNRIVDRMFEITTNMQNECAKIVTSDRCYKCPVMHGCEASRQSSYAAVDISLEAVHSDLQDSEILGELRLLRAARDRLKTRIDMIESVAEARLRQGVKISGLALQAAEGHRKWLQSMDAETIKFLTGHDVSKSVMLSPSEAIKSGMPDHFVKQFTERPQRGLKLVEIDIDKQAKALIK